MGKDRSLCQAWNPGTASLREALGISSPTTTPPPQTRGEMGMLNPEVGLSLAGSLREAGRDQESPPHVPPPLPCHSVVGRGRGMEMGGPGRMVDA